MRRSLAWRRPPRIDAGPYYWPVPEGLSERDRRKLEEGRQWAAKKMAEERERQAKIAQREAEQKARAERDAIRFGPRKVVGPDGVTVRLTAHRSGARLGINLDNIGMGGGGDSLIAFLIAMVLYLLAMLVNRLVNWVVFRGGWTLRIDVPESEKIIKIRLRSEAAAVERLAEVAEAVEREGLTALAPQGS